MTIITSFRINFHDATLVEQLCMLCHPACVHAVHCCQLPWIKLSRLSGAGKRHTYSILSQERYSYKQVRILSPINCCAVLNVNNRQKTFCCRHETQTLHATDAPQKGSRHNILRMQLRTKAKCKKAMTGCALRCKCPNLGACCGPC